MLLHSAWTCRGHRCHLYLMFYKSLLGRYPLNILQWLVSLDQGGMELKTTANQKPGPLGVRKARARLTIPRRALYVSIYSIKQLLRAYTTLSLFFNSISLHLVQKSVWEGSGHEPSNLPPSRHASFRHLFQHRNTLTPLGTAPPGSTRLPRQPASTLAVLRRDLDD